MTNPLDILTRLEVFIRDDKTSATILIIAKNKSLEKAEELFNQFIDSCVPELYVVNSTDEIKEFIESYGKTYKITFSSSYDDAYNAIFPNG